MSLPQSSGAAIAGIPARWWLRLAHDLRGPVAPMRMALQMLGIGWGTAADREESLRVMERQLEQLQGRIDDVSELLRLHAGVFSFDAIDADLANVPARVAGRAPFERWLGERQLRLVVESPPGPLLASHDPKRLAMLVEFLVRKAGQHAAPGSVLVLGLRGDAGRAHWCVHGSGPGLAQDPELRLLAGESAALEECEARCLLMREIARRHAIEFESLRDGGIGMRMPAR